MRSLFTIFYSIVRLFYSSISDEEFSRTLQSLLTLLVPSVIVIKGAGISIGQSHLSASIGENDEQRSRREVVAYRAHVDVVLSARTRLLRIRPRWQHRHLHISAMYTSKVYLTTLSKYAEARHLLTVPWVPFKEKSNSYFRSRDAAVLWDKITHRNAVHLITDIQKSPLALQVPEGLDQIADESAAQFFGSVVPEGGELTSG